MKIVSEKNFFVTSKYNESHGFAKEENSIEFYKAMLEFFTKNFK